jgi:hypothetical protein
MFRTLRQLRTLRCYLSPPRCLHREILGLGGKRSIAGMAGLLKRPVKIALVQLASGLCLPSLFHLTSRIISIPLNNSLQPHRLRQSSEPAARPRKGPRSRLLGRRNRHPARMLQLPLRHAVLPEIRGTNAAFPSERGAKSEFSCLVCYGKGCGDFFDWGVDSGT